MAVLYLLVFGPLAAGLILAFVWWLLWGRKAALPLGAARGFTLAAGLLALLGEFTVRLADVSMFLPLHVPRAFWLWYNDNQFAVPLLLGILGAILLTFPVRSRRGQGTAELTRRTPASFIRAGWFTAPGVVLAFILLITVLAGGASRPDSETGRYMTYWVEPGAQLGMGTRIYGWFYSVPALILAGVLTAVIIVSLFLIARPALEVNRERDIRERTIRARNVITGGTGALLLHLGLIFHSLSATSSMRGEFATAHGPVTITPPFSAFGPAFDGASIVCAVFGVALWAIVAFSAIPSLRRERGAVGS